MALIILWDPLFKVHWTGYIIGGLAAAATAVLWFHHRYGFLATALVQFVGAAVIFLLTGPSLHHIVSVSAAYLIAIGLLTMGNEDLKKGKRFAMVQGKEWDNDRAQARQWLGRMRGKERQDEGHRDRRSAHFGGETSHIVS